MEFLHSALESFFDSEGAREDFVGAFLGDFRV